MNIEEVLSMPIGGRIIVSANVRAMDWLEWAGFFPEVVDGERYVMRRDHHAGVLFAAEPERPQAMS